MEKEAASFANGVQRAAEVFDLQLPTQEVKTNVLTEKLQLGQTSLGPLLPFNKALMDPLLGTYAKPCSGSLVNRQIARHHCPALGDPDFLTPHPTPESLVVQALACKVNPNSFTTSPP